MDSLSFDQLVRLIAAVRGPRKRPPWDEATFFQLPKITASNYSPGTTTQLVAANGNRVALLVSATGSLWIYPSKPTLGNTGLFLSASAPTLIFLESEVGILCQNEWWINGVGGTGSGTVTAIEVLLREWPT